MSATHQFYKFPSIENHRNLVRSHREYYEKYTDKKPPKTVHFRGTVKLHGSHGDVVFTAVDGQDELASHVQSRNRVLTPMSDNAGFALFLSAIPETVKELGERVHARYVEIGAPQGELKTLTIAGEWCGGNVQSGVALSQLPKMFVFYSINVNGKWLDFTKFKDIQFPEQRIFNISRAPIYEVEMDYEAFCQIPDIDKSVFGGITLAVELECPFAKSFGVSGTGEGVVWEMLDLPGSSNWLKVKGKEHQVSKVPAVKGLSEAQKTALQSVKTLVPQLVTAARLQQGLDYLREMNLANEKKNVKTFMEWVLGDVLKEDVASIRELGANLDDVKKEVTTYARTWFIKQAV